MNEAAWKDAMLHQVPTANAAVDIKMYRNATLGAFKDALDTTNAIVAYIDHGAIIASPMASGLCFTGNNCLMDRALTNIGGIQYENPTGWHWFPQDSIAPKAKVVFLGACGITKDFISFWNLQPGHVLIVPDYNPTGNPKINPTMEIFENEVAWEWAQIASNLAAGNTVDVAVKAAKDFADLHQVPPNSWKWKVIPTGGGNVKFPPPSR